MSCLTPKQCFPCSCPRHTLIPWKIKKCNLSLVLARFIKWDSEIIDTCDMQGRRWDQFFDSKFHKKGWVSCKRHSKSLHWLLNGSNAFLHTNMRFRVTPSQLQKKLHIQRINLEPRFPGRLLKVYTWEYAQPITQSPLQNARVFSISRWIIPAWNEDPLQILSTFRFTKLWSCQGRQGSSLRIAQHGMERMSLKKGLLKRNKTKQRTTNNEQPTTKQRTTNNQHPTPNNQQPTTNNQQQIALHENTLPLPLLDLRLHQLHWSFHRGFDACWINFGAVAGHVIAPIPLASRSIHVIKVDVIQGGVAIEHLL